MAATTVLDRAPAASPVLPGSAKVLPQSAPEPIGEHRRIVAPVDLCAAAYVRMSTDHQQYSTANQLDAITRHAQAHGLTIVRTFADEGRSGLSMQGRDALQTMLDEITCGRAEYRTLLVFDVSRWGRFQDCDESAHYEYLCRRSGIRVEYCMEPFSNDGTPITAVIKHLKRVMAAEYSRELSNKVIAGKHRLVQMGYRQGGWAGYGLRRAVLDENGKVRVVLEFGQHKYLQSDRVVLVPGPAEEIANVRWIYRQIIAGKTLIAVRRLLNERGVASPDGQPWTVHRVKGIVTNEKYLGNLLFNRTNSRLHTPTVQLPEDQWLRVNGAFPPIVSRSLFDRARRVMDSWTGNLSEARALDALRAVFDRHGKLTARLINATPRTPNSDYYRRRFGSLARAYAKVGYHADRDYGFLVRFAERLRLAKVIRADVSARLRERGVSVERVTAAVMRLNSRCRLAVMVAPGRERDGRWRWEVQCHHAYDQMLVARLDPEARRIQDYWLIAGGGQMLTVGGVHRPTPERWQATDVGPLLDRVRDYLASAPAETSP